MTNLVEAAEQAAIEAEKALEHAAIYKDAAGAAFDKANAAKIAVEAVDERERKRRELAASASARAADFGKADAAYEAAVKSHLAAKATAEQVRETLDKSVRQFGDADLILAQAIAKATKDGEKTDAELIAELPKVIDDLLQADLGQRKGEFGSCGIELETYAAVRDNPGHWINRLRNDGKFVAMYARNGKRWQTANPGYIETEIVCRSAKSPYDVSGIDRDRRVARIERDRAKAVAYEEAN